MVEFKAKVGPKGQVVIPKPLRDEYGIEPKGIVVFREGKDGITVSTPKTGAVEAFREIAFSGKARRKYDHNMDYFGEAVMERMKKAGLK